MRFCLRRWTAWVNLCVATVSLHVLSGCYLVENIKRYVATEPCDEITHSRFYRFVQALELRNEIITPQELGKPEAEQTRILKVLDLGTDVSDYGEGRVGSFFLMAGRDTCNTSSFSVLVEIRAHQEYCLLEIALANDLNSLESAGYCRDPDRMTQVGKLTGCWRVRTCGVAFDSVRHDALGREFPRIEELAQAAPGQGDSGGRTNLSQGAMTGLDDCERRKLDREAALQALKDKRENKGLTPDDDKQWEKLNQELLGLGERCKGLSASVEDQVEVDGPPASEEALRPLVEVAGGEGQAPDSEEELVQDEKAEQSVLEEPEELDAIMAAEVERWGRTLKHLGQVSPAALFRELFPLTSASLAPPVTGSVEDLVEWLKQHSYGPVEQPEDLRFGDVLIQLHRDERIRASDSSGGSGIVIEAGSEEALGRDAFGMYLGRGLIARQRHPDEEGACRVALEQVGQGYTSAFRVVPGFALLEYRPSLPRLEELMGNCWPSDFYAAPE